MTTQVSPRVVADVSLEAFLYSQQRKLPEVVEIIYSRHSYKLLYDDGTVEEVEADDFAVAEMQFGFDDGWTY